MQVIFDIEVPRMAFGRVCLIGDAAFAVRPHIAAGTAKAASDAWGAGEDLVPPGGDVLGSLFRFGKRISWPWAGPLWSEPAATATDLSSKEPGCQVILTSPTVFILLKRESTAPEHGDRSGCFDLECRTVRMAQCRIPANYFCCEHRGAVSIGDRD